MPAFYTHARFGENVLKHLEMDLGENIITNKELFEIGLQGPDILFYYKGYSSNYINKIGNELHNKRGVEFFQPARKIIEEALCKEDAFSYLAGFICHFTLDSQCHPYIIGMVEPTTGISHTEIEAEVDRYLMIKDQKDFLRYLGVKNFVKSKKNTEVISLFFDELSPSDIKKALNHMLLFSKLFCAPGKVHRAVVHKILKLAGQYESKAGLIVNYEENQKCYSSTRKIVQLSDEAVPVAVHLIKEFQEGIGNADFELSPRYLQTFCE